MQVTNKLPEEYLKVKTVDEVRKECGVKDMGQECDLCSTPAVLVMPGEDCLWLCKEHALKVVDGVIGHFLKEIKLPLPTSEDVKS